MANLVLRPMPLLIIWHRRGVKDARLAASVYRAHKSRVSAIGELFEADTLRFSSLPDSIPILSACCSK